MVKNNWWGTFFIFLILGILLGVISIVLEYIPVAGFLISLFLVTPFAYIFIYILTLEAKREHEKS